MKNCKDCGVLLVAGVNWAASRQRNYMNWCNDCNRVYQAAYRELNREASRTYQRQWWRDHNEERIDEKYRTKPPRTPAEYLRDYRASHPEAAARMQKAARRWREGHPERHNEGMADSSAKRRATILNNGPVDDIDRRAVWGRDEGHCRIGLVCDCDFVPFEEMEVDHIVPIVKGGTHTWNNVQASCRPCNRYKAAKV